MTKIKAPAASVEPLKRRSMICRRGRRSDRSAGVVVMDLLDVPTIDGSSGADLGDVGQGLRLQVGWKRRVVDVRGGLLGVRQQIGEEPADRLGLCGVSLLGVGD